MQVEIDRKSGIPIYLQLKKHIEYLISTGFWERGRQLPTERALAEELGISRNTVSVAYRELEAEGLLASYQGKGTFVAGRDSAKRQRTREERVMRVIDAAMGDAMEIGFSIDEFADLVNRRAGEKKELIRHLELTFVECNREQLEQFAKDLELGSGVHIRPLLIEDLTTVTPEQLDILEQTDMIATTFFHIEQLKKVIPERSQEIVGIALDPDITTMVKVARLPRGPIALVCISRLFAERVLKSLALAGLEFPKVTVVTSRDREDVAEALDSAEAVIVSPSRRGDVEKLLGRPLEVIEFVYRPDEGSINTLRSVLVEKKEARLR